MGTVRNMMIARNEIKVQFNLMKTVKWYQLLESLHNTSGIVKCGSR
jgi:hypothetical protein